MKIFVPIFLSVCIVFLGAFGVNCLYGYLFPVKYEEEVGRAAKEFDVKAALIFSVINVESHFRENAISSKGAVGLMQILPATAQDIATKLDLKNYNLKNPQTNIRFGTFYLSELIKNFGDIDAALAAYNAGPTNVRAWLKEDESLNKIPFKETREYIKKVRKNLNIYFRKRFLKKL